MQTWERGVIKDERERGVDWQRRTCSQQAQHECDYHGIMLFPLRIDLLCLWGEGLDLISLSLRLRLARTCRWTEERSHLQLRLQGGRVAHSGNRRWMATSWPALCHSKLFFTLAHPSAPSLRRPHQSSILLYCWVQWRQFSSGTIALCDSGTVKPQISWVSTSLLLFCSVCYLPTSTLWDHVHSLFSNKRHLGTVGTPTY